MNNPAVDVNTEEKIYLEEVAAVKQWWNDSRWRYTKRPFTAEQIVAKRGNLKIEYPSNAQSKKLWKILEGRFQVSFTDSRIFILQNASSANYLAEQRCELHVWMLGANHVDSNGQIS